MMLTKADIFGVRVDASQFDAAADAIHMRSHTRGGVVCVANVDMVTRAVTDRRLFDIMRGAYAVVADGMPLVWRLRAAGQPGAARVCGPQLMTALCARAARGGSSVFFYGGTSQELALSTANLVQMYPALRIAGAVSPPMLDADPPLDMATVDAINQSGASILFVGLGCPKQEYWMGTHSPHLHPLCIGVGYAFALTAGLQRQAPAWMQRSGLEWLFRLAQEPGRLWRRYLIGNSKYFWYLLRSKVGWQAQF